LDPFRGNLTCNGGPWFEIEPQRLCGIRYDVSTDKRKEAFAGRTLIECNESIPFLPSTETDPHLVAYPVGVVKAIRNQYVADGSERSLAAAG
jgi:hypothetical protein